MRRLVRVFLVSLLSAFAGTGVAVLVVGFLAFKELLPPKGDLLDIFVWSMLAGAIVGLAVGAVGTILATRSKPQRKLPR